MNTDRPFYVYVHKYASGSKEGQVFYVGKGVGDRAFIKKGRNQHWKNVVAKYGYTIEIVFRTTNDVCARSIERGLISLYGFPTLTNMTNGGEGWHGRTISQSTRDKISKSLRDGGNHVGMLGRSQSEKQKNSVSAANKGRFLGIKSARFNHKLHCFEHKDGRKITCTVYDLNAITSGVGSSGHAYSVVIGTRKSVKGWSLSLEVNE